MTKATRVVAWAMSLSTALWLAVPSAAAATPVYKYEWVSQSGTISADGLAHEYAGLSAGQTLNLSLSMINRSGTTIKGTSSLGAIPAGKQVQVGAWGIGTQNPQDGTPSFLDASSFVLNGNRFVYYDGADVPNGGTITFNWTVKMSTTVTNGVYNLYVRPVSEYNAWTRQYKNGRTLPGTNSDIFWRLTVGSGTSTAPTGGLSVNLGSGTPVSTSIAAGGTANFTKITLTPASGATVSITSLYITRSGLSTDAEVQNVQLLRVSDNTQVGNTAGGFNATHKAQIFFSPAMALSSATDFYLRASIPTIANGAVAGNTIGLGILANTNVVSNATSVAGAPVTGNLMTIVSLTIGTLTVGQFGAVADSTPDVGNTDVITNTFQLVAGSVEDVTVEQITAMKAGSASNTDTSNIELYNNTTGTSVATVASWNAEGKAVFNFNPSLVIPRGNQDTFTIRIDIMSGSGLTVNTDIVDGTAPLVMVHGNLYGYYITPTVLAAWGGTGAVVQTIKAGALIITKSAASAATGNVAVADNQALGTWDFNARGEDIRISALHVNIAIGQVAGLPVGTDVTNARIYDETGNIVAGPIDGDIAAQIAGDRMLDFTQTFVIPVGTHQYTLKVRIGTAFLTTDTLVADIIAAGDVTARTIRTNTAVVPTGVPALLNVQTVKGGAIAITTMTLPAARQIAMGVTKYVFAVASLSANGSGEDVRVTSTKFTVTTANQADPDALANMEVWADLTSAASSRGDAFETRIGITQQPSGANAPAGAVTYTWALAPSLTIPKDQFIQIAFVGDIIAGVFVAAGNNDTFTVKSGTTLNDTTATGVSTGTAINVTAVNAGQAMTVVNSGAVVVTLDTSSPQTDILVGGTSSKTIAVYRLTTTAVEVVDLRRIKLTNQSTAPADTGTWYLYSNRDGAGNLVTPFLVASLPTGATVTFNVPGSTVRIPADAVGLLTVKVDVPLVDGVAVANNDNVISRVADLTNNAGDGTTLDTDVDFSGVGSGSTICGTGTNNRDGATNLVFKSRPYVSVAADSPSGPLTPSAAGSVTTLLAKFNVTADAAFDIAFTSDGGGNDSRMTFRVNAVTNDDGVDSAGTKIVDLSNASTTVYATANDLEAAANIVCDFDTGGADMIIAAGTTHVVAVYGDTQAFEDTGDSVQIWMDHATANSVTFGTTIVADSAANAFDVSAIVLRGDKFAGTLVKA